MFELLSLIIEVSLGGQVGVIEAWSSSFGSSSGIVGAVGGVAVLDKVVDLFGDIY